MALTPVLVLNSDRVSELSKAASLRKEKNGTSPIVHGESVLPVATLPRVELLVTEAGRPGPDVGTSSNNAPTPKFHGAVVENPKPENFLNTILAGEDPQLGQAMLERLLAAGLIEVYSPARVKELSHSAEQLFGVSRLYRFEEELSRELAKAAAAAESRFAERGLLVKAIELVVPSVKERLVNETALSRKEAELVASNLAKLGAKLDRLQEDADTLHQLVPTAAGYYVRVTSEGKAFAKQRDQSH